MAECAGNRRDVLSEIQLSVDEVLKSFLHGYNLFQGFSAPASLRGEQVVARTAVGKDSEPVELPDPREVASQIMEQLKKLRSLVAAIPVDDDTLEARHESLETLVEKVAALREELRHGPRRCFRPASLLEHFGLMQVRCSPQARGGGGTGLPGSGAKGHARARCR